MIFTLFIDGVHERSKRGGFSAADGTRHEHEAVVVANERADHVWQSQFLNGTDAGADDTEGDVDAQALLNDGSTEASKVW